MGGNINISYNRIIRRLVTKILETPHERHAQKRSMRKHLLSISREKAKYNFISNISFREVLGISRGR